MSHANFRVPKMSLLVQGSIWNSNKEYIYQILIDKTITCFTIINNMAMSWMKLYFIYTQRDILITLEYSYHSLKPKSSSASFFFIEHEVWLLHDLGSPFISFKFTWPYKWRWMYPWNQIARLMMVSKRGFKMKPFIIAISLSLNLLWVWNF